MDRTWTELGNRRRRIGDGRRGGHGDITSHKGRSSKIERVFSDHKKQTALEQNKRSFSGTSKQYVSDDEAAKRAHRKEVAKKVAIGVVAVAGIAAAGIAYVKNYRKQHPNTKKTDAEIKEMYEKGRKS